jgi:peptide/nickel transport system substrate-binding protein
MNSRLAGSLLLITLTACGDSGNTGATGGTVILTVPSAWTPGPPPVSADQFSRVVSDMIYDRLAEMPLNMNTIGDVGYTPKLAQSWAWSKDSLSIAFSINPNARWHDGKPVRASDVRFTLSVFKDPKTGSAMTPLIANVDSITVRDSLTAVAWFHRRTAEQFWDLVFQMPIMPEHIWANIPHDKLATSDAARAPIGSGRFRFVRFEPGVRVELMADTANYRGRPKLDRLVWSIVPDIGASVAALLTGQADVLEFMPPDVVAKVDSSATHRSVRFVGLLFSYMGFNMNDPKRLNAPHPIFGDRQVRRALSMAMDRAAMLRNVFDTNGVLGSGPYPRAMADTGVKLLPFDRAHAAALLDSAGWVMGANGIRAKAGKPLTFSVMVPSSSRPRMNYAVLIQEQLKSVGADMKIETLEFQTFRERQAAFAFDAAMMSTSYDPSPSTLKQSWSIVSIGKGGQNFDRYANPVFDATLDSALAESNPAKAQATARRAYQMLVDDAPAVWLYDVLTVAGIHKRIRPVGMRGDAWWANLDEWWIPANERTDRDKVGLRTASP